MNPEYGSSRAILLIALAVAGSCLAPAEAGSYLSFDGVRSYVEVPGSDVFSLRTGGGLTVSAWMRPARLTFPSTEGSGYVLWMGKGEKGRHEWVFRMYSQGNVEHAATASASMFSTGKEARGLAAISRTQLSPESGST